MAKLNDLNRNYKKTEKLMNVTVDELFPELKRKIRIFKSINQNIFIWGGGSKSLIFLIYLKSFNPTAFKKVKFAIDIDKDKQNKLLQIVNIKIISPKTLIKVIKLGDTIIVANSNYFNEIKKYVKSYKLKKINYRFLDQLKTLI
tara:strand:- start:7434 stop:7865 length:432 start_codon:yes stop_codon:yes gene_type:complete